MIPNSPTWKGGTFVAGCAVQHNIWQEHKHKGKLSGKSLRQWEKACRQEAERKQVATRDSSPARYPRFSLVYLALRLPTRTLHSSGPRL